MYVKQTQDEVANVATAGRKATKQEKMSVQQLHEKWGHINERVMKETAGLATYGLSTIELCSMWSRKSKAKVTQESKHSRSQK